MPLIRQKYTKTDPKSGKRVTRESSKWYCLYKRGEKWLRVPAYADKLASQQMLARLEREVAREAEGVFDHLTPHLATPIADHAKAFEQHLADRGRTPEYVQTTAQRLTFIIEHTKATTISDITPASVDRALAELVRGGGSISSRNHYLRAAKMFTRWMVGERRLASDPLIGMASKNTDQDRRRVRRPLNDLELRILIDATWNGPPRLDMSGRDRVALYLVASLTGYRRNELGSITPASFAWGKAPTLTVQAGTSKRRRLDVIPLRQDAADWLRAWMGDRPASQPLFPITDARTAEMLRDDLAAAREAWLKAGKGKERIEREQSEYLLAVNAAGRVVDFHALRGTFITSLAKAGVNPKTAQTLARHSTMDLTMITYAHLELADQHAAVESLPAVALPGQSGLQLGLHKKLPGVASRHPATPRNTHRKKSAVTSKKRRKAREK